MDPDTKSLKQSLRRAGLSVDAIAAAWPDWWNDDATGSRSAQGELRFALARKLGLAPKPLLGDRVQFVWTDEARFKHLSAADEHLKAAITSFGVALGRLVIAATAPVADLAGLGAAELRVAILRDRPTVDLAGLLATCWAVGTPVAHLRVTPLTTRAMHAMVASANGRHAVLLARNDPYRAQVAFTLAHEIAHIALGHLGGAPALVDLEQDDGGDIKGERGASVDAADPQESEADRYALELLTGSPSPDITTTVDRFSARELARAVVEVGPDRGIDPGTLALCVAHGRNAWPTAIAALGHIEGTKREIWRDVNLLAETQLDWSLMSRDGTEYVRRVLEIAP